MGDRAESPLVRRELLQILQDAVNRRRGRGDDLSTYVAEPLLQSTLALRGYALALEEVRGHLYWLRDEGCAKFHDTKINREHYLTWRITSKGTSVLEGTIAITGVAGE